MTPDRPSLARSLAATLMLLAALAAAVPPPPGAHDDRHPIEHVATVEASVGLTSLWTWAIIAWQALAMPSDICDDCNYPVDDGCKCVCYSGGYDPDDPACQF